MSSRGKTQKRRQDQARQAANRARQAAGAEVPNQATTAAATPPETAAAATPTTATGASTGSGNAPARSSTATEVTGPAKTSGSARVTGGSGQRPAARTTTRPGSGQSPPRRPTGRKAKRGRRGPIWAAAAGALVIVIGVIVAIAASSGGGKAHGAIGPEGVVIPKGVALATTSTKALGKSVDGIQCQTNEQTVYHVHAHLAVFVNGVQRQIPYGIGIPGDVPQQESDGVFISTGTCFYWLHTHAADGIIHIESPSPNLTFNLGQFFDIWGQPLKANQIGPDKGHITAYLDGKLFTGNLRDIPLGAHNLIQIDVGKVVPPQSMKFPSGL